MFCVFGGWMAFYCISFWVLCIIVCIFFFCWCWLGVKHQFTYSFADRMTSWTGSCWKQTNKTEADICSPFVLFSVWVYARRLTPLRYMFAQFVRCSFKLCCVFKLFRKEMRRESVKVLLSALVMTKCFLAPQDYELWLVNIGCICLAGTQHGL